MPRACIASLMTYSRSIGPTAAKPSPPRENGVRPEPLRCRSRSPAGAVDQLAEQQRAAVAEAGGVAAELVAGVGLRDRGRALGHDGAGEQPDALGAAQPVGVEAELGGQGLVEDEQSRLGASAACHGRASSGSSVANGLPRTVVVGAWVTCRAYAACSRRRIGA